MAGIAEKGSSPQVVLDVARLRDSAVSETWRAWVLRRGYRHRPRPGRRRRSSQGRSSSSQLLHQGKSTWGCRRARISSSTHHKQSWQRVSPPPCAQCSLRRSLGVVAALGRIDGSWGLADARRSGLLVSTPPSMTFTGRHLYQFGLRASQPFDWNKDEHEEERKAPERLGGPSLELSTS